MDHNAQQTKTPPPVEKFQIKCGCNDPNCKIDEKDAPALSKVLGISLNTAALMLSALKEASGGSGVPGLRQASGCMLVIVETIQAMGDHKFAYKHLLQDVVDMAFVVTRFVREKEKKGETISDELKFHVGRLSSTLTEINIFLKERLHRKWYMRIIESKADAVKVNEYRVRVNQAATIFQMGMMLTVHENTNAAPKQSKRPPDPKTIHKMAEYQVEKEIEHKEFYHYVGPATTVTSGGMQLLNSPNAHVENHNSFNVINKTYQNMDNDYSINYKIYNTSRTSLPPERPRPRRKSTRSVQETYGECP